MALVFSHCSSSLRSGSHPPHDRLTTIQRRPPKPRATAVPAISGSLRPVLSRNCQQAVVLNAKRECKIHAKKQAGCGEYIRRVPMFRSYHVPGYNYIL